MQLIGREIRHFLYPLLLATGVITAVQAEAPVPSDAEIAALIVQLGDDEYAKREAAAARLDAIGAAAIDSLLAAAESSDDLEVALRAHWLAESIPLTDAADGPDVSALVSRYRRQAFGERVVIMHRLLRADDDTGVRALARIIRLDRDPTAARIAAAILVREWIPDDPYWPGMCDRILAGLGASTRPAAEFVRTVVEFSRAASTADRNRLAETGRTLLPALHRAGVARADVDAGRGGNSVVADITSTTQLIFERSAVQMLAEAGQRDDALALVRHQIESRTAAAADHDADAAEEAAAEIADILVWASTHGLSAAVDAITAADTMAARKNVVLYAAAVCERARGRDAEATRLATAAFEAAANDFSERMQAALLLVKWGVGDWASREYTSIIDGPTTPANQIAFAAVLYAEFLHDQGRDAEAAAMLRGPVEGSGRTGVNMAILQQIGRDPLMVRARMHYFDACAAAARGDTAAQRKALEEATSTVVKDVDALIALYELATESPEHQATVRRLIKEALDRIEGGIDAMPEDTTSYNEYAWLVANTEGDLAKATRYSRQTLAASPENSSYLDTLAHCHAAARNYPLAIRTQRLAQRLEPHNRIIRLNLEKFERLAAAAAAESP